MKTLLGLYVSECLLCPGGSSVRWWNKVSKWYQDSCRTQQTEEPTIFHIIASRVTRDEESSCPYYCNGFVLLLASFNAKRKRKENLQYKSAGLLLLLLRSQRSLTSQAYCARSTSRSPSFPSIESFFLRPQRVFFQESIWLDLPTKTELKAPTLRPLLGKSVERIGAVISAK